MRELTKKEINQMGVAFIEGIKAAKNVEKYNPYCDDTTDAQDFREGRFYELNYERKEFDISEYIESEEERLGIHALDAPCFYLIEDDELGVDGKLLKCHAVDIAKHFKLI